MTLGTCRCEPALRLIVWCKACQHQVEPDPAEMAARYGAEARALDWRERLVCSRCGSRQVDMVVGRNAKPIRIPLRNPYPGLLSVRPRATPAPRATPTAVLIDWPIFLISAPGIGGKRCEPPRHSLDRKLIGS